MNESMASLIENNKDKIKISEKGIESKDEKLKLVLMAYTELNNIITRKSDNNVMDKVTEMNFNALQHYSDEMKKKEEKKPETQTA
jgi:hypothetical protein